MSLEKNGSPFYATYHAARDSADVGRRAAQFS
jgi:hypothetical protein